MSSTIDASLSPLKPVYPSPDPSVARNEPAHVQKLIDALNLQPHIEGGYFVETDRDPYLVPNPFLSAAASAQSQAPEASSEQTTFYTSTGAVSADLSHQLTASDKAAAQQQQQQQQQQASTKEEEKEQEADTNNSHRNASTSIHYLVTPASPLGAFHRNRGRTIHTLHRGRGRYVIIHADEVMRSYDSHSGVRGKARVETFVVGQDVHKGEKLQWIVEGGKYKASFLLEDEGEKEGGESGGLLISETVVPGFEFDDHDFMRVERLEALVTKEQSDELRWMLRKDDKPV